MEVDSVSVATHFTITVVWEGKYLWLPIQWWVDGIYFLLSFCSQHLCGIHFFHQKMKSKTCPPLCHFLYCSLCLSFNPHSGRILEWLDDGCFNPIPTITAMFGEPL